MASASKDRRTGVRHGFTLVELLVVIGIIALLISILLPSLNSAKRAAMKTVCLSNVRQLSIAANMYMSANRGVFPFQFGRPIAQAVPLDDVLSTGAANANWKPNWIYSLWPLMGKNSNLLRCPSLTVENITDPTSKVRAGYVANGVLTHLGARGMRAGIRNEIIAFREDVVLENTAKLRPYFALNFPNQPSDLTLVGWSGWLYFTSPTDPNAGEDRANHRRSARPRHELRFLGRARRIREGRRHSLRQFRFGNARQRGMADRCRRSRCHWIQFCRPTRACAPLTNMCGSTSDHRRDIRIANGVMYDFR